MSPFIFLFIKNKTTTIMKKKLFKYYIWTCINNKKKKLRKQLNKIIHLHTSWENMYCIFHLIGMYLKCISLNEHLK